MSDSTDRRSFLAACAAAPLALLQPRPPAAPDPRQSEAGRVMVDPDPITAEPQPGAWLRYCYRHRDGTIRKGSFAPDVQLQRVFIYRGDPRKSARPDWSWHPGQLPERSWEHGDGPAARAIIHYRRPSGEDMMWGCPNLIAIEVHRGARIVASWMDEHAAGFPAPVPGDRHLCLATIADLPELRRA